MYSLVVITLCSERDQTSHLLEEHRSSPRFHQYVWDKFLAPLSFLETDVRGEKGPIVEVRGEGSVVEVEGRGPVVVEEEGVPSSRLQTPVQLPEIGEEPTEGKLNEEGRENTLEPENTTRAC